MTLNQLRYFQSVARSQSFRAAAAELYISQPSLSRSINSLEQELGVVLFDRAVRGVTLTGNGRLFLEYADRILRECDIAVNKMKEISAAGERIDIGYVFPLASFFIPYNVRSFLNIPGNELVRFGFTQNVTSSIISGIRSGKLDIGFCACPENGEDLEFVPILRQEMVIITSTRHPLAAREELSIQELTRYPVIGYDRSSCLSAYTSRLYRSLGIRPDIVCECSDENAIQAMVREQFGIALVARADILDGDHLKIHRVSDADLVHYINIVWRRDHYLMPAAKRFIDFMISRSGPDPGKRETNV